MEELVSKVTDTTDFVKGLNAVCEKLGIAVDWTSANIAPYITELIHRIATYCLIRSIIYMTVFCIVGIFIAVLGKMLSKSGEEDDDSDAVVIGIIMIIIGFIVFAASVGMNGMDIAKAVTVPELTVYQYIMEYM